MSFFKYIKTHILLSLLKSTFLQKHILSFVESQFDSMYKNDQTWVYAKTIKQQINENLWIYVANDNGNFDIITHRYCSESFSVTQDEDFMLSFFGAFGNEKITQDKLGIFKSYVWNVGFNKIYQQAIS